MPPAPYTAQCRLLSLVLLVASPRLTTTTSLSNPRTSTAATFAEAAQDEAELNAVLDLLRS